MKRLSMAASAALLAIAPVMADPLTIEPRVLTTFLDGELTIDPAGAVESYRVTSDVPEGFATKAQEMVRQLRFEPVLLDGHPARAHTIMRITLAGTPTADDGIAVHLDDISFPKSREVPDGKEVAPGVEMRVDQKSMPKYPATAQRIGVDADVLVVVKVARDGRIVDAAVRQSALLAAGGDPTIVSKLLSEFEYESLRAVRRWHVRVDIADGVNPTDDQMTALTVFSYRMGERFPPRAGQWTWETRSGKRNTPWLPPDPSAALVGVAAATEEGLLGDNPSGFRLAKPVGEKAL